jgi:hypothetical protein
MKSENTESIFYMYELRRCFTMGNKSELIGYVIFYILYFLLVINAVIGWSEAWRFRFLSLVVPVSLAFISAMLLLDLTYFLRYKDRREKLKTDFLNMIEKPFCDIWLALLVVIVMVILWLTIYSSPSHLHRQQLIRLFIFTLIMYFSTGKVSNFGKRQRPPKIIK